MPKVSIIIPTYNRAHLIESTLDSIRQQIFTDWECLIIDDFSTDNTTTVIGRYCQNDTRFLYLKNQRAKGAPGARNTGLMYCHSPLVLFFDSDNIMEPNMLKYLQKIIKDESVDVATCWSNIVDRNLNTKVGMFNWVCDGYIQEELLTGKTYVDTNSALIRKDILTQIGGWSEDCPSFQEWDLHIRLSNIAKYHTIKKPLLEYYINGLDTISKDKKREIEGYLYILKKYKKLWHPYSEHYLQYGRRVIDIIVNANKNQYLWRVFRLFPSLPKYYIKKILSKIYHKI